MTIVSISETEAVEERKPVACEHCEENESQLELNDQFLCVDCASIVLAEIDGDDDEED